MCEEKQKKGQAKYKNELITNRGEEGGGLVDYFSMSEQNKGLYRQGAGVARILNRRS